MTRLRVAAATALLVPLALAGCAEDDPQPKLPSASATSPTTTASATPDAAVEPTLPPEAQGKDEAAAEAFVRYFWDLVNYAQETGDVKTLKSSLSLPVLHRMRTGGRLRARYVRRAVDRQARRRRSPSPTCDRTAPPQDTGLRTFDVTRDVSSTCRLTATRFIRLKR